MMYIRVNLSTVRRELERGKSVTITAVEREEDLYGDNKRYSVILNPNNPQCLNVRAWLEKTLSPFFAVTPLYYVWVGEDE